MIITPENGPEFIASAIEASALFTEAGLVVFNPQQPEVGTGIIVDDGLPTGLKGVESALSEPGKGLCIIVGQFEELTVSDQIDSASVHSCKFPLQVRENIERNRSTAGTGIKYVKAIVEAIRAVRSVSTTSPVFRRISSGPVRNLGFENGTFICEATLTIPTVIK